MNARRKTRNVFWPSAVWLTAALALVGGQPSAHVDEFDHASTGFPLTDAHKHLACEECHTRGIFQGTPRQCAACHTQGGYVPASTRPATHIRTLNACEDCHRATGWTPVIRVDHGATRGSCNSCHNGTTAGGKPATHIATANTCDNCHRTTAWSPVIRVDHGVVLGTCYSCHNNVVAGGKPANHIPAPNTCDDCHGTTTWKI